MTNHGSSTNYQQSTLPFGTALVAESSGYSNQVFTSYDRSASTGLDYAVTRSYSQGQSRFTQVDPIGMSSTALLDPQSLNLFAYTQNKPLDFVDPNGLNVAGPGTTYSSGMLWTVWYGNNVDGWRIVHQWFEPYPGSGTDSETGGNGGSASGDCERLAQRADQLASALNLHNLSSDTLSSVKSSRIQQFMNALVKWGTEFSAATSSAVIGYQTGTIAANVYNNFSSSGFKPVFQDTGGSANQVRHAIGGLLAGYIAVLGDNAVGKFVMNDLRESDSPQRSRMADRALNIFTMRKGGQLAGSNGLNAALTLGSWIRENLCAPAPREAQGGPNE